MSAYDDEGWAIHAHASSIRDRLLAGLDLRHFLSSDPENHAQAKAKNEVLVLIDRAVDAARGGLLA